MKFIDNIGGEGFEEFDKNLEKRFGRKFEFRKTENDILRSAGNIFVTADIPNEHSYKDQK